MKRWINTKVVIDRTGKVLEKQGFWYDGPFALATTPPTMEVTNWAFYNDGTEAGSTIIGSVNTNCSLNVDTIYFVRFGLEETSGNASKNEYPQLRYNLNSGGFNNVTATSSVVRSVATANITDMADTTQRITSFTFDTSNEGFDEVDGIAGGPTTDLLNTGFEALFAFTIRSADVANNDTIILKIVDFNDADADYDVYNQTDPTITVIESAGGTTFYQNAGQGAVASVGVLSKKTSKFIGGYAMNIAGVLNKKTSKFIGGYAINIAGILNKKTTPVTAMGGHSIDIVGSLAKAVVLTQDTGGHTVTITGALTSTITFVRAVGGYAVSIVGTLLKKTSKGVGEGQVASTGNLSKMTSKNIGGGSVTSIGTLATAILYTQAVGGASISIIGSLTTQFIAGVGGVLKAIRRRKTFFKQ